MKKTIVATILMILMCCVLWGCGKSEAVKNVEALIDGIGEVTTENTIPIVEAEKAYNALTDEEKKQVKNADQLEAKKQELEILREKEQKEAENREKEEEQRKLEEKKTLLAPFLGTWKALYGEALINDHNRPISILKEEIQTGDIIIKDSSKGIQPVDENTIRYDYNGIGNLTLKKDDGIEKLVSSAGVYVREEEYEEIRDKMFVHVVLDEDNISDYIGGPVEIGRFLDEWGEETDSKAYTFASPVYNDEDLIMLTFKDVKYEMYFKGNGESVTYYEPYPVMSGWGDPRLDHFGRAEGEIWYIKKEYVDSIEEMDGKDNARKITFKDGYSIDLYVPSASGLNISVTDYEF